MNIRIIIYAIILQLLFAGFNKITAQQEIRGLKQLLELNIDELGNAEIAMTMKLNAMQWDNFKRTTGNNQASLKRLIERGMPSYFFSDFKYEEEPMERTYTFTMKAPAVMNLGKNGKWKGELDMKDPDITQINDREFRLDLNMLTDGGFVEQVQKIKLPKKAKNAKIENDSFGKAVLTYELKSKRKSPLAKYAGIILILSGFGLFFVNFTQKRNNI